MNLAERPSAVTLRHVAAANRAADQAGAVLRSYFRTPIYADRKDDESPVTIADRAAEAAMHAVLTEAFPEHGILGEELGLIRPGAPYRWVLDPIDGTRAFITGRPVFGTLIALTLDGTPVLGLIDQPVTHERWLGVQGQPTQFNGRLGGAAGTRQCGRLAVAELSCTSPEMLGADLPRWQKLAGRVRRVSWGGDGYAYGLLALGHIDVIAECDLKIWDWAALLPVIEGAGGLIRDWQGHPLSADSDGRVLAVGDPRLLEPCLEALHHLPEPGGAFAKR